MDTKVLYIDGKGNKREAGTELAKTVISALDGSTVWAGAESNRAAFAMGLNQIVPNLLDVGIVAIELESDNGFTVYQVAELPAILPLISAACNDVAEVKELHKDNNKAYQIAGKFTPKPQEHEAGKRGRKGADYSPDAIAARLLANLR